VRPEQHVEGIISYSERLLASAVFQQEIMNPNNSMTYCVTPEKNRMLGWKVN